VLLPAYSVSAKVTQHAEGGHMTDGRFGQSGHSHCTKSCPLYPEVGA